MLEYKWNIQKQTNQPGIILHLSSFVFASMIWLHIKKTQLELALMVREDLLKDNGVLDRKIMLRAVKRYRSTSGKTGTKEEKSSKLLSSSPLLLSEQVSFLSVCRLTTSASPLYPKGKAADSSRIFCLYYSFSSHWGRWWGEIGSTLGSNVHIFLDVLWSIQLESDVHLQNCGQGCRVHFV